MAPPLLPDFPLLTGLGHLPSPPPLPPSPYPRDPKTLNTLWPPISSSHSDLLRQRRKLVRYQKALDRPLHTAAREAAAAAKEAGRYALHFRREKERKEEQKRLRQIDWSQPDIYKRWRTGRVLPEDAFLPRVGPPASVACLTGIPARAWGYGRVCMAHELVVNSKNGLVYPLFGMEIVPGMRPFSKLDPWAQGERTARFERTKARNGMERMAWMGKRDGTRGPCLRCEVKGLGCSLTRVRTREEGVCGACRRNGCGMCLQVVVGNGGRATRAADDEGKEARFEYVVVRGRGREWVVYVRDTSGERPGVEEVRRYADEMLAGDGMHLWGTVVDANDQCAMRLPDWKQGYEKLRAVKEKAEERGEEWGREEWENDPTSQDYFRVLDFWRKHQHAGLPRQTKRQRPRSSRDTSQEERDAEDEKMRTRQAVYM